MGGHTETTNQKTDYISSQHYNLLFVEGTVVFSNFSLVALGY